MRLTFLLLILLLYINTNGQDRRMYYTDVDFWEYKADTLQGKLDSFLIIGIGTSKERLFLNDLGDKLIKDFAAKNITATYSNLGKNLEEANKNYVQINQRDYRATIVFSPTDTGKFYIKHIESRFNTPLLLTTDHTISRNRDTYVQAFDITLYTINGSMKIVECKG